MATMKIKTPLKSWEITKEAKYNNAIKESIGHQVAKAVIEKTSESIDIELNRQISILATFFQRLVARTPLDESYEITYVDRKGNEKKRKHTIDTSVCQDSWYITDGKVKVTAKQMKDVDHRMFWNINDKYMVDQIKKIINDKFIINGNTEFTIGNDNDHFARLEYGYSKWFNDGITAKKSVGGLLRDHGVKNMHSIQAPVGMWRYSYAEYLVMKNSKALSSLSSRYRAQVWRTMKRDPNKKMLKDILNLLKDGGIIQYKDMKRYLEKY